MVEIHTIECCPRKRAGKIHLKQTFSHELIKQTDVFKIRLR